MPARLVIQTYVAGEWHDALLISVSDHLAGRQCSCSAVYLHEYLYKFIEEKKFSLESAVSVNIPLSEVCYLTNGLFSFLYDIIPGGAARDYLGKIYADSKPRGVSLDFFLLSQCTPSPIGNLRVKSSVNECRVVQLEPYSREDINRGVSIFSDAVTRGRYLLVGAMSAQGDAPKLAVVEGPDGAFYADAQLPDCMARRHWLVKFPRGRATERDKNILRAEYCYYKAVSRIGLNTISIDGMTLEESVQPSLWLPRFDRRVVESSVERIPVESFYSICDEATRGASLKHEKVLQKLIEIWTYNGQSLDVEELIFEYLQRDLLNRILGNSDNHGRNSAILRAQGVLRLAPIYDLAPMVLDPQGVTRMTKWESERVGRLDWAAICGGLKGHIEPDALFERLRAAAEQFRALPDLLIDLPLEVKNSPVIPLSCLDRRLAEWDLRQS